MDLENARHRKSSIHLKQTQVAEIKKKVEFKTVFGVQLRKTQHGKTIMKDAKELHKMNIIRGEEFVQDKIDELRKLKENIMSLTPKTVSTNCIIFLTF